MSGSKEQLPRVPKPGFGLIGFRARRRAGEALLREKIAIFTDYECSGLGWFWSTTADGTLSYISDRAASSLGLEAGELLGRPLGSLIDLDAVPINDDGVPEPGGKRLNFLIRAKNTFTEKEVRVRCDSREIWWSFSGRPQFDEHNEFTGYRGNACDVTLGRRERADARRLAQFDSLTGLANRLRMSNRLHSVLSAFRAASRPCALMMVDLDRFKQINDTLGHPSGDALLKQVALRLKRIIGKKGEIGRLGGDEFQIILPDRDDPAELASIANHIVQMLSQPYLIEGDSCVIGASVGIAIAPLDGLDADDLVRATDLALYAAKGSGRGHYRFYSSELRSRAMERREIEKEMRKAIRCGEFELHYQPLACPSQNRVKGFEALLRWNHPQRGMINPAVFISIAEETGMILPLGEWVLRQACDHAAQWPQDIRIAVNLSPAQLMIENLPGVIARALANAGLAADRLELEITESVFLGDKAGAVRMIEAIVRLANSLDMETAAIGIETMDELEFADKCGITSVQGFIYGSAMPNEHVRQMISMGKIMIEPNGPRKTRATRRSMLRNIWVISGNDRHRAIMRNISQTGACIQGLVDVPVGEKLVVDLGHGQLVVAEVKRSQDDWQGIEFEQPLISDGGEGWRTRHRVSPYAIAQEALEAKAGPDRIAAPTASIRRQA